MNMNMTSTTKVVSVCCLFAIFGGLALVVVAVPVDGVVRECNEHFGCRSSSRNSEMLQYLKLNSTVPTWYELCNCDDHCHLFGDCCVDAPILSRLALPDWSFVRIKFGAKLSYMSLMKNRCPANVAVNDHVRQMCEQSGLGPMYDYVLPEVEQYLLFNTIDEFKNWHVTGQRSLITYRNVYCSACNNETDVDSWSQRLKCNNNNNNNADDHHESNRCTAIYHQTPPDELIKAKLKRTPLQNKVYANCNLGWYKMNIRQHTQTVLDIVKKCLIYYQPVVVPDTKSKKVIVFKNRYCAQCNNYDDSSLQCPSTAIDQLTAIPPTYTVVTNFDADYRTGSIIEPGHNRTCLPGEVYNPLRASCLPLSGLNRNLVVGGLAGGAAAPSAHLLGHHILLLLTTVALLLIANVHFFVAY